MPTPQRGDFVRVRTRRWLVEDERSAGEGLTALRLACVDDDAQGEVVEVLWDAELDGSVLKDEGWASVAKHGTDDPSVFSAYLRALRWNTATAADWDLGRAWKFKLSEVDEWVRAGGAGTGDDAPDGEGER